LFAKAKEHLELEPGSHGRRSGRRVTNSTANDSDIFVSINHTVHHDNAESMQQEKRVIHPYELNAALSHTTKRTQSMSNTSHELNGRRQSRKLNTSSIQVQCRQSELEMIFRVRSYRCLC
jgi:hypothetical protein